MRVPSGLTPIKTEFSPFSSLLALSLILPTASSLFWL